MVTFPPVQQIGGLSPHGVFAGLGFVAGLQLFLTEVKRRGGIPEELVIKAFTYSLVLGVVGARLAFVVTHWSTFAPDPWSVLDVRRGGLALFGALVGGALPPTLIGLRIRAHLPRAFDVAAPAVALGIAVGRIGDLIVWDHLGEVAPSWLGWTVREGYRLAPGFGPSPAVPLPPGRTCEEALPFFFAGCSYHQPALYDLAGAALLCALLLVMRRRARARAGTAIFVFAAWYGTQRFLVDTVRVAEVRHYGLTGAQWFSLLLAVVGVVALVVIRLRGRGFWERPDDPPSRLGPLVRDDAPVAATS